MRRTTAPATIAVMAGLTIGALLLTRHRVQRCIQPARDQLADAHRAGYALALTHVSRGLYRAAPEEP
ncbi:hypothetical protein [Streptomyces sp. DT171]|uniref:hypothetical protein n=1 Tax=Streptomyces sp. DT171 TaxID=3416524 RepID=UPI003CF76D96